jgi:serine O-acetyltransferase
MIDNKEKLKECLALDAIKYPSQTGGLFDRWLNNLLAGPNNAQKYIWRYIKTLRYAEYNSNCHGFRHRIMQVIYLYKLRKLSNITGFQIPLNTTGPGLQIFHWGTIIINGKSRLGCDVTLYPGVLIGWKNPGEAAPVIGNNVFIGSGAKIIGDVKISDNAIIGQNCVIVKDVKEGSVIVTQPPREIKQKSC